MRYRHFFFVWVILAGLMAPMDASCQENKEYTVQKGDTLWDISKKFRGTPYDWPDLWYINKDLPMLNPHLIFPGQKLLITPKSGLAPALSFPQPSVPFSQPQPSYSQPFSQPAKTFDQPGSTDSAFQPGPDIRKFGEFQRDVDQNSYTFSLIEKAGFITKEPTVPYGVIFKVKDDKSMISKDDMVYIKETNPEKTLIIGKQYTIFRVLTPPLLNKDTKATIGSQHLLLGILEIKQKEPNLCIGVVASSSRPIRVGDMIIPYSQRSPKIDYIETPKDITGRILISEDHANLIGPGMVAFIDKGVSDGVKPGQRFFIYEQHIAALDPKSKETILLPPIDYAVILVLLAEETTSTVVVTYSVKNIYPGAPFRAFSR